MRFQLQLARAHIDELTKRDAEQNANTNMLEQKLLAVNAQLEEITQKKTEIESRLSNSAVNHQEQSLLLVQIFTLRF